MKRGLALIVVIGILGVLAVLAAAFVMMAQLERRASQQRVHVAKAYLLARSGIEDALARLDLGQDSSYGGENWDGDGALSSFEAAQEVYHRGVLDTDACPARHAMRPSFFARVPGAGDPDLMAVDGRQRGYSGLLAGDEVARGNGYALKVSSRQGFYINGGDPSAPPDLGYNAVLRRMLGNLAKAIDEEQGGIDGNPVSEADGLALLLQRPASGWQSLEEVRRLALGGSQGKLEALRPYLTLRAWVDKKVVAPNVHEGMIDKSYHSWGDIKLDHLETISGSRAPGFERIHGRIVGRAPVDLSWARKRRPALIALLGGLKGLYLDEREARQINCYRWGLPPPGDIIGVLREAELSLAWSSTDDCHQVADRILTSTSELATWRQWNDFCDTIPDTVLSGAPDLRQAKRDLLKANFNPNSDLNKFSPNLSTWKLVDKGDLLATSTEFSLLSSIGPKEVSCVGRVLGSHGRLLASRVLGAIVSGPGVLRLSTQREFVCQELGSLDTAGDEIGVRLPGQAPFISLGRGRYKTWGHDLPGMGGQGLSLQTYPEPWVQVDNGVETDPADYDGSVQLATIETPRDEMYGVATLTQDMKMLARYTGDFDLDVADAAPNGGPQPPPLYINPKQNHPDLYQVTSHCTGEPMAFVRTTTNGWPTVARSGAYQTDQGPPKREELRNGVLHASKPNTLYPDGCYAEKDRAPEYLDKGNADGFHGVMSFWIKANHAPPATAYSRGHPFVKWTNVVDARNENGPDQFFCLADFESSVRCHFEIGRRGFDNNTEHHFKVGRYLIPHRWHLLTFQWDFLARERNEGIDERDDTGELVLDAGLPGMGEGSSEDAYTLSSGNDPSRADDITAEDLQPDGSMGPHRIGLGRGHPEWEMADVPQYLGSGADATFDEFAIYDFGSAYYPLPTSLPASTGNAFVDDYARGRYEFLTAPAGTPEDRILFTRLLAANRFKEGRYYKESAYSLGVNLAAEYFSPPIRLGAKARIRGLAWTQIVPKGASVSVDVQMEGDPAPPDAAIAFDLADLSGTTYAQDAQGRPIVGPLAPIDSRFTNPAFSPVDRAVDRPFRLHAIFQPNLADPINTPILDPLALDDITVYHEPLAGPRVISWEAAGPDD